MIATNFIKFYQKFISPLFPARCKYYPSCSQYSIDAFRAYGFVKGLHKSAWRIMRCNPWSLGGVDYAAGRYEVHTKTHLHMNKTTIGVN